MTPQFRREISLSVAFLALLVGMYQVISAADQPGATLAITSTAFANSGPIGETYACTGSDISPELYWTGAPDGTRAWTLIVEDPDAPSGVFIHWVVYNLPRKLTTLAEDIPQNASLDTGGVQGVNGAGKIGYFGPCPPAGKLHHYHFKLYALDAKLNVPPGASATTVKDAMQGHVLGTTELIGTFER
ncbi:MAG TPA: YbhB/YbcL family Raf kinase inhibitor-like protein [Candidatus Binataceae bacterium]|nr:YbhB/YbcL family Raf kinase inhibitor-like protein [Candidatus Binataceae bacterium]